MFASFLHPTPAPECPLCDTSYRGDGPLCADCRAEAMRLGALSRGVAA